MGHYTGLLHLGQEAMAANHMPVYATASMADFLRQNAPWSALIDQHHLDLRLITPETDIFLSPNLRVRPYAVPHLRDYSDTLAFTIHGTAHSLFFCPDIDRWTQWPYQLNDFLNPIDVALLDASFYSPAELPGRDLSQIPHPFVTDTVTYLADTRCQVYLIHLNHSNPLYQPGPERAWVEEQGVQVGQFGQRWRLDNDGWSEGAMAEV
jgi:pyrroloquinoline quinone biosynthesis protein B